MAKTKCIVKTAKNYTLLNTSKETIPHGRPSVTTMTPFVENKMHEPARTLRVLASGLPMEANDKEFVSFWNAAERNEELAVKAYCAKFGLDTEGNPIEIEGNPIETKVKESEAPIVEDTKEPETKPETETPPVVEVPVTTGNRRQGSRLTLSNPVVTPDA